MSSAVAQDGPVLGAVVSRYPSRVLVVDDHEASRAGLREALQSFGHEVTVAEDGLEALARLRPGTGLVVLDAEMPGLSGFEVARRVRCMDGWTHVPILMVTGLGSHQNRLLALKSGVNDFLTKPWDMVELLLRSDSLLRGHASVEGLRRERADLERQVSRRTTTLRRTLADLADANRLLHQAHLETIRALVLAAEHKDADTAAHIDRMRWFTDLIARGLGLPKEKVDLIREATPMHDVGKIGVPDAILGKAGPLTEAERAVMRTHTTIGGRILAESGAELLRMGRVIALNHHERWDGRGYPAGIGGEDIPLPARICAVADVFDALSADRVYRKALPRNTIIDLLRRERGRHFDPVLVDVFLDHLPEVDEIVRARDPKSPARPSGRRAPESPLPLRPAPVGD